jgi:glutathione synthase/RimK-type ligase-like ATP-grasp enzyme
MVKRVLITGARSAAALDIARDFAAAGWEPHLADCVTSRLARWSSLSAHHHSYPPPRQQAEAFQRRILALIQTYEIDLIVPTCEEVFHLAAPTLHARIGERLFAPDLAHLRTLHDKLAFARAVQEWGLNAPESVPIETSQDLETLADTSGEWVIKPRFTRFGEAAIIAPDRQTLKKVRPSPEQQWMAQRYIAGQEVCFYAAAHRGKLTAFAAYTSSWRLSGGACYAFEPAGRDRCAQLLEMAAQIAGKAHLHGQFGCDVIFDARGIAQAIECNPRATSGVHMIANEGDLARAIAEGIPAVDGPSSAAYLAPAMWFFGLPRAIKQARIREWQSCLNTGRDAISRPGDRLPFAGAVVDTARFALKGFRRRISTNAATTSDIEWNGEELN